MFDRLFFNLYLIDQLSKNIASTTASLLIWDIILESNGLLSFESERVVLILVLVHECAIILSPLLFSKNVHVSAIRTYFNTFTLSLL